MAQTKKKIIHKAPGANTRKTRVSADTQRHLVASRDHDRLNPGIDFDLEAVLAVHVNRSAAERRCATLSGRRTVKQEWQIGWLLRAITLIDLTTLAGDDTDTNVQRLCRKAARPLRHETMEALQLAEGSIHTGAVCVYDTLVPTAVRTLRELRADIPVAAVSTGFPAGLTPLNTRLAEIKSSVKAGAKEIDIVIHRALVLGGQWRKLYDEVRAMREACGDAHLKAILATGELATLTNVARASWVCMMAGADFIKTSTGKEAVNATLPVSLVMTRAIADYLDLTGCKVGFKPAGGIRTAKDALNWMILMKEELGDEWLEPHLFRFGASTLLSDIERQLDFHITGEYSSFQRHPTP